MILKKIVCTVKSGKEVVFSKGQEKWSAIAECSGFIAQHGGWVKERENVAVIGALWRNHKAYDDFMENVHDSIYEQGQEGSIDEIEVRIEECDWQDGENTLKEWLMSQHVSLEKRWSVVK
ncbi:DUF4937 domain-containing protein [Alkalihalobacillus sp. CinArs1]|uniref:DUF4937 domain-containing protein n=1 Tax=Alkalihalobacillus sp. CinArs1 TaxID=2995314 RepID=UPI0022DD111D|nr:DUF4937 domain-containing protein [Alkalihalobacillus sp. CinArs1]